MSLKEKIEKLFKSNSRGRGKQPFFNELNEELVYEYLKKCGCYDLSFPLEGKVQGLKMSDLEFKENGNFGMCEVKTISVSDVEKKRFTEGEVYPGSVYSSLDLGFLNKLKSDIDNSLTKMEGKLGTKCSLHYYTF